MTQDDDAHEILRVLRSWLDREVEPVVLEAKEGLALNNGTQFMTAIGVLALLDAECVVRASIQGCGLSLEAIKGVRGAFLRVARPQPGGNKVFHEPNV